ncbi:MAG: acyl-ACP thioesterase [Ilumatobacter sp.]
MPTVPPATELVERPTGGRVFTLNSRVRLGDVDRRGRLRLDATARFMQDVATDDANDVGLDRRFGWLVRRTLIDTRAPATLGEPIRVSTWCAGIGGAWAERRTSIVGERGGRIEAVSLWVQIDVETGAPARIAQDFTDAFGETSAGRTVSARLALNAPRSRESSGKWALRRTDLDPFGHVNNAATWAFLEEHGALDDTDRIGRAELEYPHPVEPGTDPDVVVESVESVVSSWLIVDGTVAAAGRWTPS